MVDWPTFAMPPRLHNQGGTERVVGLEVEFGGLDVASAGQVVSLLFGGTVEATNRFTNHVRGARYGDWRVEIDSKLLTQRRYKDFLDRLGVGEGVTDVLEGVLETVARAWIPFEIVSPPIPLTGLSSAEALREALLHRRADGTGASLLYTFGLQFNPEIPSLDASTMTRYLRAFLALYDWLVAVSNIDFSRRVSAYVDPFPKEYRLLVIDPAYAPDMHDLIDDYLTWNPTRNRALDMLPAFRHVNEAMVVARADEPHKIRARPTFHYRLPDSRVDDPRWSFAQEWNRWVEIERLAEDPERLAGVSADVLKIEGKAIRGAALIELAAKWGLPAL